MKPDSAVRRETARVAAGVFALVAAMLLIYAIILRCCWAASIRGC